MGKTEKIKVTLKNTCASVIELKIVTRNKHFESYFSLSFDPTSDYRNWLQAIAIGVYQTSFRFFPEWEDEIVFDFTKENDNTGIFTIYSSDKKKVFLNVLVGRRQLVNAFYNRTLEFINSQKNNPKSIDFEKSEELGIKDIFEGIVNFRSEIIENFQKE